MGDTKLKDPFDDRETIECDSCGTEMWDEEQCREEMETHQAECDGISDPKERFDVGDRVKYSAFGLLRLDREQRTGEVVGFSEQDHCVRVRWDENKTPSRYAHRFIKHVDRG